MLDFLKVSIRYPKRDVVEVYPKFKMMKSSDLMIRGGDFYAIWDENRKIWSTDEQDAIRLVDRELEIFAEKNRATLSDTVKIMYMWDADTGTIDKWHKYCQKQLRDNYTMLDETLIFSNTEVKKEDFASKRLPYPLEKGDCPAFKKLISTLYSEEERHKIEWAIGAIVSGDSKWIQKFMVLYGAAGTGKSTILNVIQQLFEGYYSVFDAKALGSASSQFALEPFKTNPLVAIQHDGDLSKIEDNTRLNSLVSHELMTVNEKFKAGYSNRFKCFLLMGTNKPVKITDGKSGLMRRLIDVTPSGNKLNPKEYKTVVKQVSFELGAIANYCLEVYLDDPGYYDDYKPSDMLSESNDFFNFIIDSFHIFKKEDNTTLKQAWEMYKQYCEDAKVPYPMSQRGFKNELKNYFYEFNERFNMDDGSRVRSYYSGFKAEELFNKDKKEKKDEKSKDNSSRLVFKSSNEQGGSIFDKERGTCQAQYATDDGIPSKAWDKVRTKLSSIDTSRLHYVKVPENHIVIDFDLKDETGKKSFERNLKEASKWPPTYAELSKSEAGIHLHYIYAGDVTKLSRVYGNDIEVKVFTGKSSLRRKLTKCNNLPIATISSGLPLKGDDKLVDFEGIKSEKMLRNMIIKNLNKEYHANTKCSMDFIHKLLEDSYNQGLKYDVSDMKNDIVAFAVNSTNQSDYCIKLVRDMKFKSEETSTPIDNDEAPIVFCDTEVFPNLFLVNWKFQGKGKPVVRMINPKPKDIEELFRYRLIGFNNRGYDNHMLYAAWMGYSNEELFDLSSRLVSKDKTVSRRAKFGEAFNISYTDVYDYAAKKQSLKKWEIDLGIHHLELGLPWNKPVPKELWPKVAEYCDNDVIATEAVFDNTQGDFLARQILAELAGMTVNDTTNSLSERFIFMGDKNPQSQFNYRDMGYIPHGEAIYALDEDLNHIRNVGSDDYNVFDEMGRPLFPGYKYEYGVSTYRGEEVGEGGYVYAEPGIHVNVALLDVASMHPSSAIAENLFGDIYTKRFEDIKNVRLAIKHRNFDLARTMLDGALANYLTDESMADALSLALKIVINSVYGLTSAKFPNAFRDSRNKDNIVAKRGALFMINLKHEVQKRGYTVAHIKTDSIKIPNATPEIIKFVMDYGKKYGYDFEHEATYDRMCLVNDAVYIAKYKDGKHAGEWTATGTQFAVPYVYKKLFTNEPIVFEDMCETKSVAGGAALYLDMNEYLPDVSEFEKELKKTEDNYKKGKLSDTTFEKTCEDLQVKIADGHDYRFVGRVGNFCPIKPGMGGGVLMRGVDEKYSNATGTTGYRWLEAEMVKDLGMQEDIDTSYYNELVDKAVEAIRIYGDFEWFASDDPYPDGDAIPFA